MNRSLYGLRQAHLSWFEHLKTHFESCSFTPCSRDQCLFINKESKIFCLIYVNDVIWVDMFLFKTPIAPCYCQMMGRTLKEEIRITQYNNPTKARKYSLEDLFRASDNIPHHYHKF